MYVYMLLEVYDDRCKSVSSACLWDYAKRNLTCSPKVLGKPLDSRLPVFSGRHRGLRDKPDCGTLRAAPSVEGGGGGGGGGGGWLPADL